MTEMNSIGKDFADAIQIDHLNDEQILELERMFKDFK